jgi:hypothetical protein
MSLTSHDRFFGYIHSFKINRNNYFFGGQKNLNDNPYPKIIHNPTYTQVVQNWNSADTGLVLTFCLLGIFVAKKFITKYPT